MADLSHSSNPRLEGCQVTRKPNDVSILCQHKKTHDTIPTGAEALSGHSGLVAFFFMLVEKKPKQWAWAS
jgi:hypothetical protein